MKTVMGDGTFSSDGPAGIGVGHRTTSPYRHSETIRTMNIESANIPIGPTHFSPGCMSLLGDSDTICGADIFKDRFAAYRQAYQFLRRKATPNKRILLASRRLTISCPRPQRPIAAAQRVHPEKNASRRLHTGLQLCSPDIFFEQFPA